MSVVHRLLFDQSKDQAYRDQIAERHRDRENRGLELEERFLPVPGGRHPAARVLAILRTKRRPRSFHPCSIDPAVLMSL
jgi:hypothetical protein